MKIAVIYYSKTGFTKKYADWIVERTGADCYALDEAKKADFSEYEAIIFGSWWSAGMINKVKWFKEQLPKWEGKKVFVYTVGGSPIENPDIPAAINNNFDEELQKKIKVIYCPGGFNYEKMGTGSRMLMKVFAKSLQAKKNKTEEEAIMAKMVATSYDISDIKYLEPLFAYLQ